MPIKIQNGLPARAILESENVFIMDEDRAESQDIRPLEILILNLMPLKEDTETQLLRALSNTPLQVECTYMTMSTHESTHTSASHLNKFYVTFPEIKKKHFDGMIITGAPVELMEFEEVNYWEELTRIMEWSKTHVTSTMHLCWGLRPDFTIITESRNTYGKKNFPVCIHRKRWISVFRYSEVLTITLSARIPAIQKCGRRIF